LRNSYEEMRDFTHFEAPAAKSRMGACKEDFYDKSQKSPVLGAKPHNLLASFFFLLLLASCATRVPPPVETAPVPPPPAASPDQPRARLVFDRVEAAAPKGLTLLFRLEADNPGKEAARLRTAGWKVAVNGIELEEEGTLTLEGASLAAGSSGVFSLRLETVLAAEMLAGAPGGREGEATLIADIVFTYSSGGEAAIQAAAAASFPLIREPEVRITAIAVKKAELVNTRFKVSLKIDNPNVFPVELSAFSYELYNGGRLWADGAKEDILVIPPESSAETDLFLVMNFINMSRELLNQVTALRDINYRFTGEASVGTGIEHFPQFNIKYDLSGYSEVTE
jgi:LEA14-like dessication related protein